MDDNRYSYGLTDPSSPGAVILLLFIGLILGGFVGIIAFVVSDYFTY